MPGIWALGDCNGRGAFAHTAYNDFEIIVANLLDNDPRLFSANVLLPTISHQTPLGRVGLTEAEVRESVDPALMAKMAMEDVSRAFEKGETQGFMKVLVDAQTKRFLGASILGVGSDEVVHAILDLMYARAPCTVMQRAVHPPDRVGAAADDARQSQAAAAGRNKPHQPKDCARSTPGTSRRRSRRR